jgi:uncharacterized protein YqjF (DUF2071 family)
MAGVSYLLKRHPFPITAHFEHVLVLTYALPVATLAPLIPPGLELDTYDGQAFLAVATVQTRDLRPSFLPATFGRDFFLTGYRIFTKFKKANGQVLRGLRILRSDTDSASMVTWGNRLTRYGYRKAAVTCTKQNGHLHFKVDTPGAEADLELTANIGKVPGPLPEGSPFPDVETARRFAGPLPYTFDYEPETNSMIVVLGRRSKWNPQPLEVQVHRNTFLDAAPFAETHATLANAFYLEDVPYGWDRGCRESLPQK